MNYVKLFSVCLMLLTGLYAPSGVLAQDVTTEEETLPLENLRPSYIATGDIYFRAEIPGSDSHYLIYLNSLTGEMEILQDNLSSFSSVLLTPSGDKLVYRVFPGTMTLLDTTTGDVSPVSFIEEEPFSGYRAEAWSPDGERILASYYGNNIDTPDTHALVILHLAEERIETVFEYEENERVTDLAIPDIFPEVLFSSLDFATWNPAYPEWITFQIDTINPRYFSDGFSLVIYSTIFYNLETEQSFVLENMMPTLGTIQDISWHPDGRTLFVTHYRNRDRQFTMLDFNPEAPEMLRLLEQTPAEGLSMRGWSGLDYVFFTYEGGFDRDRHIVHIARIVDGETRNFPLFDIPKSTFEIISSPASNLEVFEDTNRPPTCLMNLRLPGRADAGETLIVLDNTPQPLYRMADRNSDLIRDVPPRTEVTLTGESVCTGRRAVYQMVEVTLDDGTQGWMTLASTKIRFLGDVNFYQEEE